jgi:DNA-binding CsgD family transcriptional regulator
LAYWIAVEGHEVHDTRLSQLIERIYDFATDPTSLVDVLAALSTRFGASGSHLFTPSLSPADGGLMVQYQQDENVLKRYQAYYGRLDLWWQAGLRMPRTAASLPHTDDELVPRQVLLDSEFYNDFMLPAGVDRAMTAIVSIQVAGVEHEGALAFHGATGHRGFTTADKRLLRQLLPHLQKAVTFAARLRRSEALGLVADGILESFGNGALLLDAAACVVHASRAARDRVSEGQGLRLANRRLVAWLGREQRTLDDTLMRACAVAPSAGIATITRPACAEPLVVTAFPLPRRQPIMFDERGARALVVFRDPCASSVIDWPVFGTHFGLTAAELRLCRVVHESAGLADACVRLGISVNTGRTQLRAVFEKTGIHSQRDLLRIVEAFAGVRHS